ncbi:MAG: FAD binding domain-containing protein [Bryobacteraceae bacterium]
MQAFQYANPSTLKEALSLLDTEWGRTEVLAGGTDLLSLMKEYVVTPERVVNLKAIKELGGIRKTGEGLRIGATVTFDELIGSPLVKTDYPALVTAAAGVGSPQIRNLGTVGGDLCQRPRCWYFRTGFGLLAVDKDGRRLVPNGENRYHAILGNTGAAQFVSASSLGPPLIALGAKVRVVSALGQRDVAAAEFFVTPEKPDARETVLKPNEVVREIIVPSARGARNATYEVRQKQALDWPLVTASVWMLLKGGVVQNARVVLGHVAPVPWVASAAAESLKGNPLGADVAGKVAKAAVADARPLSQNGYKVQLAQVAVKRALQEAAGGVWKG